VWDKIGALVPCEAHPASGALEVQQFGVVAQSRERMWFDSGWGFKAGDGISIVQRVDKFGNLQAVNPPRNYLVERDHDWEEPGELELEVERTTESFTT
jgi:hypothetical protein